MGDLERVVDFINVFSNAVIGSDDMSVDRLQAEWGSPSFDPHANVLLIETAKGELVGDVVVIDNSELPVNPRVYGYVHPGYEGQGIGSYLMGWAENRAAQVLTRVPNDARVVLRVGVYHGHKPSAQLLEDRGYQTDRFFWRMVIDLHEPPASPEWPEGIQLRPFDRERDGAAVYRAEDEAFEDHWGYVPESFEVGFEHWSHWNFHGSAYDPGLWFIAARGRPRADHDPEMGWIRTLSVRRPWRRKGLALALLLHSFDGFWRRSTFKVGLGVDGQNPTGATRLYEKAGMKVALQYDAYSKELRPGKELMSLGLPD
jgi:GNAT superfamily N-acetyltransferase